MRLPGWTADTAPFSAYHRSAVIRVWNDDSRTIVMQGCHPVDFTRCSFIMSWCFAAWCWWVRLPFVSSAICTGCMTSCLAAHGGQSYCYPCLVPGGPCTFGPPCWSVC
jgi:hypothetical protein